MKTFVLGNENSVLGFSLVGIEGAVIRRREDLAEALSIRLADDETALLLVTSDVAELWRERIDELKVKSMQPLVVEIPGESTERGYPPLKEFVQKAVGISLGGNQ